MEKNLKENPKKKKIFFFGIFFSKNQYFFPSQNNMNPMATEKLDSEWKLVQDDFQKLEKIHDEYIQKSRQVSKFQETAGKAMKHHNYLLKNLKETMRQAQQSAEKLDEADTSKTDVLSHVAKLREELAVANLRIRDMQGELPAQTNGFYLNLILGSNLNVSLLTKAEKFKYKQKTFFFENLFFHLFSFFFKQYFMHFPLFFLTKTAIFLDYLRFSVFAYFRRYSNPENIKTSDFDLEVTKKPGKLENKVKNSNFIMENWLNFKFFEKKIDKKNL
nr:hypothetical protein M01G5.4 - Caenorhabditis elegans [Caenorhabditis elegans]